MNASFNRHSKTLVILSACLHSSVSLNHLSSTLRSHRTHSKVTVVLVQISRLWHQFCKPIKG
uniref:Uncharacterized protein n=1 Tax=Rhizophora mucronata TaxID=61149 RepID=A0A2P2NK21_RHIMU